MQLCNLNLRLGGSLLHTVPIVDATPAEILILKHIHGDDATVDIRPTTVDKKRTRDQRAEWERLASKYDQASSMKSAPGDEHKAIMPSLFPGAMKKLPLTLEEIGLKHLMSPSSIRAAEARTAALQEQEAVEAGEGETDDGTESEA